MSTAQTLTLMPSSSSEASSWRSFGLLANLAIIFSQSKSDSQDSQDEQNLLHHLPELTAHPCGIRRSTEKLEFNPYGFDLILLILRNPVNPENSSVRPHGARTSALPSCD